MTKKLHIISCCPNDLYFIWQLRVQLHNFRKFGYSDKYTILVWKHSNRSGGKDFMWEWRELEKDYPEAEIVYYEDSTGSLQKLINTYNYIPLLRPWLLTKYFRDNPDATQEAILYLDSDVIFTKYLDFTPFLDDDVCYMSNTQSYIAASYFDSKIKDVIPEKKEAYMGIDVLNDLLKEFGLSREVAVANENNSGGAQYLLKNMDADFWEKVFKGCITVKINLGSVNRRFFENEDKGFQSWCADMFSILFNLWAKGSQTSCPNELDFAWATDSIEKWDKVYLYHDAGASTRPIKEGHLLFHKRELRYLNNIVTPLQEDLSFVSKDYCSWHYARAIEESR